MQPQIRTFEQQVDSYAASQSPSKNTLGIVRNAAKTNAKHAEWLLERSWPNEYARTERVEQIGEKADEDFSLKIYYNTHGQPLSELLAFPIHSSMKQGHDSPKVGREKRRRLLGETAEAPAQGLNLIVAP